MPGHIQGMAGSAYFAAVVVVIGIVCAVVVSPLFLIPAVVLVLVAVFSAPILGAIARGSGERPAGTTTTADASYEPVSQPEERTV
jgi:uncharacterized membrane protein YdfJ with MMPL/SSD domain